MAKGRGKTEMVEKREKVGQLCPSTETGTVQGWAMAESSHLINQSTTVFPHTTGLSTISSSYFNLILYPPAILPCSQSWEKARREWQFWLEEKLMMV